MDHDFQPEWSIGKPFTQSSVLHHRSFSSGRLFSYRPERRTILTKDVRVFPGALRAHSSTRGTFFTQHHSEQKRSTLDTKTFRSLASQCVFHTVSASNLAPVFIGILGSSNSGKYPLLSQPAQVRDRWFIFWCLTLPYYLLLSYVHHPTFFPKRLDLTQGEHSIAEELMSLDDHQLNRKWVNSSYLR
jgi:hypothetical protein